MKLRRLVGREGDRIWSGCGICHIWGLPRVTTVTDRVGGTTMLEDEYLAERFEAQRPRLKAVAYRMLGTFAEAEDAVQEAWLKLARSDAAAIDNLDAWLTTVVSRVCLDMLRARRLRNEDPL